MEKNNFFTNKYLKQYEIPLEYQKEYISFHHNLLGDRLILIYYLVFVFFPGSYIFDYLIYPEISFMMLKYRLVCVAITAGMLWLFKNTSFKKHPLLMTYFILLITALTIIRLTILAGGVNSGYYAGLNLLFLCMAMVSPWTLKHSICGGITTILCYIVFVILPSVNYSYSIVFDRLYFLSFNVIFVSISTRLLNNYRRRQFVDKKYVELKNNELDEINKKLADLNKIKSNLYTSVTHDIKTPIATTTKSLSNTIKRLSRLSQIEDTTVTKIISESITSLNRATNALKNVKNIAEEMTEVSKMEDSVTVMKFKKVNLKTLLENLILFYQSTSKTRSYILNYNLDTNEYVFDGTRMGRIIENLLSNATKYCTKGTITINASHIKDQFITLTISDNGVGIKESALDYIFDRYKMVDGKYQKEGQGVGLSIVKDYVEFHGGEISVESTFLDSTNDKTNSGTTFTIHIPDSITQGNYEKKITINK